MVIVMSPQTRENYDDYPATGLRLSFPLAVVQIFCYPLNACRSGQKDRLWSSDGDIDNG